jgi:hypothetical protein
MSQPNLTHFARRPHQDPPTPPSIADMGDYAVREEPLGSSKHIRIVGIGAGASGINMVRTLRRSLKNFDHIIYEKNAGVGGTWHENRYPGCRCDVPSHNYQFSWRPKKDWSNFFSPAEEINDYLSQVCEEENMTDVIKLRHQVVGAAWNDGKSLWELRIRNLATGEEFTDSANFLVDATGILKWVSSLTSPPWRLTTGKQLEMARDRGPPRFRGGSRSHGKLARGF